MSEYTWVKRATAEEKAEMQVIIDVNNEMSEKERDSNEVYELVRAGDAWGIKCTWLDDGLSETGSFVRCKKCGDIDDLWAGQEYECWKCATRGAK